MFLVQLAALALTRFGESVPFTDADGWRRALESLSGGPDAWDLVQEDPSRPAFMQPAMPEGLKSGAPVPAPDAIDVTVTSRNHDQKRFMGRAAPVEDWIYALVTLQTMSGYSGRGLHGTSRMNGGFSSRPCIGLAPGGGPNGLAADDSARWRHDLGSLMARGCDRKGAVGLMWTVPWDAGGRIPLACVTPLTVEVSRRIRLAWRNGCLSASTSPSDAARVDAKAAKGVTGDHWAPVHESGRALTLKPSGWTDGLLARILASDEWRLPPSVAAGAEAASRPDAPDGMLLCCSCLVRGKGRTEGLHERTLWLPREALAGLGDAGLRERVSERMEMRRKASKRLAFALAAQSAGGSSRILSLHRTRTRDGLAEFGSLAGRTLFPSVWLPDAGGQETYREKTWRAAAAALDAMQGRIPCPPGLEDAGLAASGRIMAGAPGKED